MKYLPSQRGLLRTFSMITAVLTLLAISVRCLNLFFFFDADIGYYKSGAVLPVAEAILLFASVIFFAVISILWHRRLPVKYASPIGIPMKASASVAALLSVVTVCLLLFGNNENLSLLSRLLPVFALITATYFLLNAGWGESPLLPRFLTGMGVIAFLLIALSTSYFDLTVPMNAPIKILFQIACVSGMLFQAEELRILVDAPRHGLYLFSLGCTVLVSGTATIPTVIAIFAGVSEAPVWTACYSLLLGLFFYAIVRMFSLILEEKTPVEEAVEPAEQEPQEEV